MTKNQGGKNMDPFLSMSREDWRDAITDAALEKSISPVIMEKDFWVCFMLERIFSDPELEPHFVFKGGTSLSKVYQVIERFSEDVDLGITPAYLGISEDTFEGLESRTGRDKALVDMQVRCGEALEHGVMARLEAGLLSRLGKPRNGDAWLRYEFDDRVHSPVVYFRYPSVLPDGLAYIQREVKLEIGSLTDQRPTGLHEVRPWLAETFPALFTEWHCKVTALEVQRTFWEKATILHAEFHRPEKQPMPVRQARHFSDFANLLLHAEAGAFLADKAMCIRVAQWKDRVFARKWAKYAEARHGSFRLVPQTHRLEEVEKDYALMRPMFLTEPMPFTAMLDRLQDAEHRINAK